MTRFGKTRSSLHYVRLPYKGSYKETAKLLGFGKEILVYYILTSKKITIEVNANTTFADLFELWRNDIMILITENEIRYTVVDQSDVRPNSVLITSFNNDLFLAGKDAKLYTILLEDGGTVLSKIATVII